MRMAEGRDFSLNALQKFSKDGKPALRPIQTRCSRVLSSLPVSSRTFASGSSAAIKAPPIRTASTPTRYSSSNSERCDIPLSATTVLPAGTSGINS